MLRDKSLVITGASQGIGRALAEGLAVMGARLVLNARDGAPLETARAVCEMVGGTVAAVPGDCSESRTAQALVQKAMEMGEFAGYVHMAGVLNPGPLVWELGEEGYDEVFASNVKGGWQMARFAIPKLRPQGWGLAVHVGSGAAMVEQPGIGVYCSAKAAAEHFCRQLAVEVPWLTAFVYRPGLVDTRMQEQARSASGGGAEALRKLFKPWQERGKLMRPEASAFGLIRLLEGDWSQLRGKTFDMRDA